MPSIEGHKALGVAEGLGLVEDKFAAAIAGVTKVVRVVKRVDVRVGSAYDCAVWVTTCIDQSLITVERRSGLT